MITKHNIYVHELIGLRVEVLDGSRSKAHVGLKGVVVDETRNTFTVSVPNASDKIVPKKGQVFRFYLPNGDVCAVKGESLLNRPENRLKRGYSKYNL